MSKTKVKPVVKAVVPDPNQPTHRPSERKLETMRQLVENDPRLRR